MLVPTDLLLFSLFLATSFVLWIPFLTFFILPKFLIRTVKTNARRLENTINLNSENTMAVKSFNFAAQNIQEKTKLPEKKMTSSSELAPRYPVFSDFLRQRRSGAHPRSKLTRYSLNPRVKTSLKKLLVSITRKELINEVDENLKVLDIGCGNGLLAKMIKETRNAKVTCVDVIDFNETGIETLLFNGVNLPFKNKSFDIVLLSFVLHHSGKQIELLTEAKRVCNGKIIIYEDDVLILKNLFAKLHEKFYNFMYHLDSKTSPVTYRSINQWRKLFYSQDLKIKKEFSTWGLGSVFIPIKKSFFVLEPLN